jgi:hypothetical protein
MVTGAITRLLLGSPDCCRRSLQGLALCEAVTVPLLLRYDNRAGQHEHGNTSLSGNPNASSRVYPLARGGARREDVQQDP